jgi:hypothetical protein
MDEKDYEEWISFGEKRCTKLSPNQVHSPPQSPPPDPCMIQQIKNVKDQNDTQCADPYGRGETFATNSTWSGMLSKRGIRLKTATSQPQGVSSVSLTPNPQKYHDKPASKYVWVHRALFLLEACPSLITITGGKYMLEFIWTILLLLERSICQPINPVEPTAQQVTFPSQ